MFKRKARRSREWKKSNKAIDFAKAKEERKRKREAAAANMEAAELVNEKPSKRKTVKRNRTRNFYTAVMLIIIAVIGVSVFNIISVNSQLAEVLTAREELEAEKEKLTRELQNVDSRDYVEQQARMMLRMIKPGEIYYVIPNEN